MSRRYSLKTKIEALNEIDEHDGDVARVSEFLEVPEATLRNWRGAEDDLRRQFSKKRQRQRDRLARDMQVEMLERGKLVLARLDAETLSKAPLNQLATALGSLVGNALKLEEVIEDIDEGEEKVIRWEFYYDGQVHEAPPWAENSDEAPGAIQGDRLRETLGQNRAGQNGAASANGLAKETRLVDSANGVDGEPGLARPESERPPTAGHSHQRERAAH